jgi:hypothetical protein
MGDVVSRAEHYEKLAHKYHELAKVAQPAYLGDFYRGVAVRYILRRGGLPSQGEGRRCLSVMWRHIRAFLMCNFGNQRATPRVAAVAQSASKLPTTGAREWRFPRTVKSCLRQPSA